VCVLGGASNLDADSGLAPMSSLGVVSVHVLLVLLVLPIALKLAI
jgi:hypothetical protein